MFFRGKKHIIFHPEKNGALGCRFGPQKVDTRTVLVAVLWVVYGSADFLFGEKKQRTTLKGWYKIGLTTDFEDCFETYIAYILCQTANVNVQIVISTSSCHLNTCKLVWIPRRLILL